MKFFHSIYLQESQHLNTHTITSNYPIRTHWHNSEICFCLLRCTLKCLHWIECIDFILCFIFVWFSFSFLFRFSSLISFATFEMTWLVFELIRDCLINIHNLLLTNVWGSSHCVSIQFLHKIKYFSLNFSFNTFNLHSCFTNNSFKL